MSRLRRTQRFLQYRWASKIYACIFLMWSWSLLPNQQWDLIGAQEWNQTECPFCYCHKLFLDLNLWLAIHMSHHGYSWSSEETLSSAVHVSLLAIGFPLIRSLISNRWIPVAASKQICSPLCSSFTSFAYTSMHLWWPNEIDACATLPHFKPIHARVWPLRKKTWSSLVQRTIIIIAQLFFAHGASPAKFSLHVLNFSRALYLEPDDF